MATQDSTWQPQLTHPKPGYQGLVQAIEADIRAGRLQPGTKMPTHRELSAALGISRGTVARAYDEARRVGLLDIGIGQGTFVSHGLPVQVRTPPTGVIELGMAYPLYELDPDPGPVLAALAEDPRRRELLRYPFPAGPADQLAAGALWCSEHGVGAEGGDIVVTAGAQNAIHVWLLSAFRPGDTLLTGELTYRMTVTTAEALGMRVRGVAMDVEGLLPEALDREAGRSGARGLFTMPTLQNPTAGVASEERRRELIEVIRARGLQVFEDDTYSPFQVPRPVALKELSPERVTYVASLSKTIAGGLRIAYAVPPRKLFTAFSSALNASIWSTSSLTAEIASRWIHDGTAAAVMNAKRREAGKRLAALSERLGPHVPELAVGAYFAWLALPPPLTAASLTLEARRRGVSVMPAEAFFVGEGPPPEAIRVALGCATRDEIDRGLSVLEELLARPGSALGPIV